MFHTLSVKDIGGKVCVVPAGRRGLLLRRLESQRDGDFVMVFVCDMVLLHLPMPLTPLGTPELPGGAQNN